MAHVDVNLIMKILGWSLVNHAREHIRSFSVDLEPGLCVWHFNKDTDVDPEALWRKVEKHKPPRQSPTK